MGKKGYIMINDSHYLEYFISELKDEYIPITIDTYVEAFLESRGIETVGILDYLSGVEIDAVTSEASSLTDTFVSGIDENNRDLYAQIFGMGDINLVYASMNYLFKRFAIATFRFLKGLEAIIENRNITDLDYLHDGSTVLICPYRDQSAFFFPDDIAWRIMQHWHYDKKPRLSFIKAPRREVETVPQGYRGYIQRIKSPLRKVKNFIRYLPRYLYGYSAQNKNLLLMLPPGDLSILISSANANREYNIITWDTRSRLTPEFPGRFIGRRLECQFDLSKNSNRVEPFLWDEILEHFDLHVGRCKDCDTVSYFQFASFARPLVKQFLEDKLPDIYRYWKAAENLHDTIKIEALLWGVPPLIYPMNIVKEFFRLKEVPIVGMQHGGMYGSNHMGSAIFDHDFTHCNYYLSYGFDKDTISKTYPDKKLPDIIPVGSTMISDFAKEHKSTNPPKSQVKIMYLPMIVNDNFFSAFAYIDPKLFHFQKQIIDTLALCNEHKIIKFPPGTYAQHYLRPYIESLYPDRFQIIDNLSFTDCLKKYNVDTILLDVAGTTAQSEAVVTGNNIIAYTDRIFLSLTAEAANVLSKRAVVCNTREEFIGRIIDCMNDSLPSVDLENSEYLERYCIYKGNPAENILESIQSIIK
ncbi:MAG: hypothetical protein HY739_08850 [Desulfobacterales bacterium]|nr:hypothetical protein [Desulfobacterales bacterium]